MRRVGSILGVVIVMVGIPLSVEGAWLGRFFTTPEVRAALDEADAARASTQGESVKQRRRDNRVIQFNGMVKRSDGPTTVWINGDSNLFGDETTNVGYNQDLTNSSVTYRTSGDMPPTLLLPGQGVAMLDGVVREGYDIRRERESQVAADLSVTSGVEGENAPSTPSTAAPKAELAKRKPKPKSKMAEADALEKQLQEANKIMEMSEKFKHALPPGMK